MEEKEIEIISWVKFNKPDAKKKVLQIAAECPDKMEFVKQIRNTFNIPLSDANEVANRFYKKQ